MALGSGPISFTEAYEERYGDGQAPSSDRNMNTLKETDWEFDASEPDNSSIFENRGRPEGSTDPTTNIGSTSATFNGSITNAGGYDDIDCDWRFRYRETGTSEWTETTINTVSGTFTGAVDEDSGPLQANTQYEVQLQLRNIHDAGEWQSFSSDVFTTDS